ncbi:IS1 family transposase [Oceaniovalibus sp. ACAM 378]|uniref:IS1 family transposase n=1 Tax=Oceaniovalibus sp. ACAM 378 TaxID=2599923 RepID=UPI0011D8B6A0|nr:IS1 family transposase [Oceaniovalibus sp. ACAM 378]TYB89027.1 IS1 family transposase [Oceaniovalibus sp. ACAM 378]
MRKLDMKSRTLINRLLVDGNPIHATSRIADVSKNTVTKLLEDAGRACAVYLDEKVKGVESKHVQADEIWSFCYAKAKNIEGAKAAPANAGDIWTWAAMDRDSKLMISYTIGDRSGATKREIMFHSASRVATRIQLTTDSHCAYLEAVTGAFSGDVDYAMLIRHYGNPTGSKGHESKYSPSECTGTAKEAIFGNPIMEDVGTSHIERQNLKMRMGMRRFTSLTNALSKKAENHAFAVVLHFMRYNFCRTHKTLRMTLAMAAGVSDRLWDVEDIGALVEAAEEAAPKMRGPYRKKSL